MARWGNRGSLVALAGTVVAVAIFFGIYYGGGVAVGAFVMLEMLLLLALALGVAWATARKR